MYLHRWLINAAIQSKMYILIIVNCLKILILNEIYSIVPHDISKFRPSLYFQLQHYTDMLKGIYMYCIVHMQEMQKAHLSDSIFLVYEA